LRRQNDFYTARDSSKLAATVAYFCTAIW
jgi:hypothetical protein